MLQFLSPFALFALAGLLAPLVIHLLSRRSGKRVKVGSIQFLVASESRRLKSLKLNEIALLLLRCVLLALLVLLLAQPQWLSFAYQPDSRGWVLIAPELLSNMNARIKEKVDSLSAAGHELRAFTPNFPRLHDLGTNPSHANCWSLARELVAETRDSKPMWIFTSDAMHHYRGARPVMPENFLWHSHSALQAEQWLHAAKFITEDSLQLILGSSAARQTTFSRFTTKLPALPAKLSLEGFPPVEIFRSHEDDVLQLQLRNAVAKYDSVPLAISTAPKIITIYFDEEHSGDRRYVQAALESATEFAAAPWQIRSEPIAGNGRSLNRSEVVFWLSGLTVPKELEEHLKEGALLLTDAGANKYHTVSSAIMPRGFASDNPPRLWRKTSAPAHGFELWRDAQGATLLCAEPVGAGWHLRFQSRFHLQWSELVLHPMFPQMMLRLVERRDLNSDSNFLHDQRRLTHAQLQPRIRKAASPTPTTSHAVSFHLPLWLLAAILFAWERQLSERSTP